MWKIICFGLRLGREVLFSMENGKKLEFKISLSSRLADRLASSWMVSLTDAAQKIISARSII